MKWQAASVHGDVLLTPNRLFHPLFRQNSLKASGVQIAPSTYPFEHSHFVEFFKPTTLYSGSPIDAKCKNTSKAKTITSTWKIQGKIGKQTVERFELTALKYE